MSFRDFISKQFIDVIEWVEPGDGVLAYRYPMQDREIQNGGKLTVRDSQMAVFVNEGKVADVFGPGLYTLNTQTLPILTYLRNWDKAFKSPFKSDLYFLSTRLQTNQHWGTPNPITIRDKEFGAVRMRGFGIYTYHIGDPKVFYTKVSGTRDLSKASCATRLWEGSQIHSPIAKCRFSIWQPIRLHSQKKLPANSNRDSSSLDSRSTASWSRIFRFPMNCRRFSISASA